MREKAGYAHGNTGPAHADAGLAHLPGEYGSGGADPAHEKA